MDDHDLLELLKEASIKEDVVTAAKMVADWAKKNPEQIAGGAIGGGLAGLGGYLASRPSKKTGKSLDQMASAKPKKPKPNESLREGLGRIFSNTQREIANTAAKHPVAMGLTSMPVGVAAGRTIAKMLKEGSAQKAAVLVLAHPSGKKILARKGLRLHDILSFGAPKTPKARVPAKGKTMHKKAGAELFEIADQWGRELARTRHAEMERLYVATEKVAAGVIPGLTGETASALGRNALAGATKFIRKHPIASTAGALAAGRYLIPKKDDRQGY